MPVIQSVKVDWFRVFKDLTRAERAVKPGVVVVVSNGQGLRYSDWSKILPDFSKHYGLLFNNFCSRRYI